MQYGNNADQPPGDELIMEKLPTVLNFKDMGSIKVNK